MNSNETTTAPTVADLEEAAAWHEEMARDFASSGHHRRAATYARNAADVRAIIANRTA